MNKTLFAAAQMKKVETQFALQEEERLRRTEARKEKQRLEKARDIAFAAAMDGFEPKFFGAEEIKRLANYHLKIEASHFEPTIFADAVKKIDAILNIAEVRTAETKGTF